MSIAIHILIFNIYMLVRGAVVSMVQALSKMTTIGPVQYSNTNVYTNIPNSFRSDQTDAPRSATADGPQQQTSRAPCVALRSHGAAFSWRFPPPARYLRLFIVSSFSTYTHIAFIIIFFSPISL